MRSFILTLLLLMLCLPTLSSARDITLSWDVSQDPDITGYKIYYKAGNQALPLNGSNLPQGPSPIVISDPSQTSQIFSLPDDGKVYFFAATAFTNANIESSYSEIIASAWIPLLISPSDAGAVASSVTLVWSQAPVDYNVTYTLYYGTDPSLNPAAGTVVTQGPGNSPGSRSNLLILLFALIVASAGAAIPRRIPLRTGLAITACLLVFGCGGSGGGSNPIGTGPGSSDPGVAPSVLFTEVVPDLTDTQMLLYDLEPGQDYYWKVVAVDDVGNTYPSGTRSFKAQ